MANIRNLYYEEVVAPKVKKQVTITQDGVTPWEDFRTKK